MSKSYLRGSKRLVIIQNWLNGKEDDDWEVLPTKKDGKYIVKRRESMSKHAKTSKKDLQVPQDNNNDEDDDNDLTISNFAQANVSDNDEDDEPIPPPQSVKLPKSKPKKYIPLNQPDNYKILNTSFDPTVNIQILEQLKQLGNELKYEREKKQQKQLIKHQINKQLNNHQPQPIIYQTQQQEPEPSINEQQQTQIQQPPPQQYVPKRRRLDLRNI